MATEKVSGLWKNKDKGKSHLASGRVTLKSPATFVINIKGGSKEVTVGPGDVGLLVFKNDYKEQDKHPDMNLAIIIDDNAGKTDDPDW